MSKLIKTLIATILIVALIPAVAFAASPKSQISSQGLVVNGKVITCEKYNIDGSNYFKLRDIAKLVNGTSNQFEVGWDNDTKMISLTTGKAYTSVGGELVAQGDKSSTTKQANVSIKVDGEIVTGLSVYNIGGNNYFKLRDLGELFDLYIDYHAESNSAVIGTADYINSMFEDEEEAETTTETKTETVTTGGTTYVLNTNSKKFHYQDCASVKKMKEENKEYTNLSREEIIKQGYSPCGNCNP